MTNECQAHCEGFPASPCSVCEELRTALVKITQMNCYLKCDVATMIAGIREIARDAVPDYKERATDLRRKAKATDLRRKLKHEFG